MPSRTVADAFEAKIGETWNGLPVVGVDDVLAEPPANDYGFIVIQYPVANGDKPVLGRHYFEDGAARVVLNVRREVGLGQGLTWADAMAALLRTASFGGIETFAPSPPIIDDNNDDGNYLALAVIVPYRYQFDG